MFAKVLVLSLIILYGELCGLSWADIDFAKNYIHVRRASLYIPGEGVIESSTKTNSSERSIEVTEFVMDTLANYREWWLDYRFKLGDLWKGEKERLFIQSDGKPLFPDTINFWLSRFNKKNGFEHIHPHGLRHTFATLQLASGVDIRTLQGRTGHAQASTLLNQYTHFIESTQQKAAQAMDDILLQHIDVKCKGNR